MRCHHKPPSSHSASTANWGKAAWTLQVLLHLETLLRPVAQGTASNTALSTLCRCSGVSDSLWPHGLWPPGSCARGVPQARTLEGVPFPPPGDLPTQGSNPLFPHWQVSPCCWATREAHLWAHSGGNQLPTSPWRTTCLDFIWCLNFYVSHWGTGPQNTQVWESVVLASKSPTTSQQQRCS